MTTATTTRLATAPAYAVLPAEDIARAKSFYHDTLGLEVESVPTGEFYVHAGQGTRILVYERARTVAEHTVLSFLVEDLHAVMDELRSRGVVFEEYDIPGLTTIGGIAESDYELGAWFTDPEGNIISIAQVK